MFVIIGLLFATIFLFAIAAITSAVLAGLIWLYLGKRSGHKRLIVFAVCLPPASAAYLWLCTAILPGESLFGDINEPLPNGYTIQALGKMPDFARIDNSAKSYAEDGISQCIGKVAIDGPLVVGQYSHPGNTFTSNPNEPFFILDTNAGQTKEFPTLHDVEAQLGHSIALTDVQYFRSPLARNRRRLNTVIEFGPILLALLALVSAVWHRRSRIETVQNNIYT